MWMHISIILSSWVSVFLCDLVYGEYTWVRLFVSIYVGVHSMAFLFFKLVNWRIITISWWVLPYMNMNRPYVYVSPLTLNVPPTSLPTLSLWVVPENRLWVPCFLHQTHTGQLFYRWWYTCFSAALSNRPALPFTCWVRKGCSWHLLCCRARRIVSTFFLDSIS